jgi:hypothetical protein
VGHSRVRLESLLGSLDLNEAWRREVESSRECLKVFAMCIQSSPELERRGGPFIAPQENLVVGVSETRTFRVGAGHVRPTSLKPGLGTGHVRSRT